MPSKTLGLLTKVVVIGALVLAVTSLWNDTFITDEIPHVGAGYSYITKADMRLNPEHPPLAKDLAGTALAFLDIDQNVFNSQFWNQDINGQWNFGRTMIYYPTNDVNLITRVAKSVMLVFFVLTAWLLYRWTRERYGDLASFIATFLFALSPTILAHSRFVTTDIPALFGVMLGTYFFIKYLEHPSRKTFWLSVLAFGIAQLTKFSVVLIAPLFVLMVVVWCFANSYSFKKSAMVFVKSLVMMALAILLVVWPVYGFHTVNYPPEKQKTDTVYHLGSYGNRMIADPVVWMADKPYIRSLGYYATGVLMVNQRAIGGNTTYFLGEVRNWAWKHYFPVVYAIKEPLAFWGLVITVAVIGALAWKMPRFSLGRAREWLKRHFVETSMLIWLAIYWYLSINSNLNIGVRHLIPTYGFVFFLLAGQLAKWIESRRGKNKKYAAGFVFAMLGWYAGETLMVHPYYLSYFNQLAGGPSGGYRYVVDSNLDWGQDLKRLADWVEENNISKIHLDYFGWADQTYYLKDKLVWINSGRYHSPADFLAENPQGGYLAVSASFFMGSQQDPANSWAWLQRYEPEVVIGNSIFVWKVTPDGIKTK